MTLQRRAVIEVFEATDEMLDAEQVYELAKDAGAKIDRMTVYRHIKALRDVGAVKVGAVKGRRMLFQRHDQKPRISLVDVKNGSVVQILDEDLVSRITARLRDEGFQLAGGIDLWVTRTP